MKKYGLFFISFLIFAAACGGSNEQMLEKAVAMQKNGNNEGALKIYNTILRQSPDYYPALANRAMVYERLNENKKAAQDYEAALDLNFSNVQLLNNAGAFFIKQKEPARALIYLDKAIKLDSEYFNAYMNRALAKNEIGLYESAVDDFDTVLLYDSENLPALVGKAVSKHNLGAYHAATQLFTQVLYYDPENPQIYYRRAISERAYGRYANALLDYAAAVELDPHFTAARFGKAEMLYKQGSYEAALGEIDTLKGYDNQYAPSYEFAGDLLALSDTKSAKANYNVAKKLDPKNAKRYEAKIRLMESDGGRTKVLMDTFRSK